MPTAYRGQSQVQFRVQSGQQISIQGPDGATDGDVQPQWVTDQTADLTRIAYRMTNTVKTTWRLQFNNLTKADWRNLRAFFYEVVRGPEIPFSYTHTDKRLYPNCYFPMTSLSAKRVNGNEYSVQLTIEIPGFMSALPEVD